MTVRLWIDAEKNILEFLQSSVRPYICTSIPARPGTYPCVGAAIGRPRRKLKKYNAPMQIRTRWGLANLHRRCVIAGPCIFLGNCSKIHPNLQANIWKIAVIFSENFRKIAVKFSENFWKLRAKFVGNSWKMCAQFSDIFWKLRVQLCVNLWNASANFTAISAWKFKWNGKLQRKCHANSPGIFRLYYI